MSDPCDNCNRPCCYNCPCAEDEVIKTERQEQLSKAAHRAMELTYWLSYQPEMSDSEKIRLEKMSAFLQDLRDRIE